MLYSREQNELLYADYNRLRREIERLLLQLASQNRDFEDNTVRDHFFYGAGRRLRGLRKATENIYNLFPLETTQPLSEDVLMDVQINLHAFVINLYGIFENWAIAFTARHGLEQVVTNPMHRSFFRRELRSHLPDTLHSYVTSEAFTTWRDKYLKNYRHSLAHRIPLYIPPAWFTEEEGVRYNELEEEKFELLLGWDGSSEVDNVLERVKAIEGQQENIGRPCPTFTHSFIENDEVEQVYLHPQLLSDLGVVVEFGQLYLQEWQNRAET